MIEKGERMMSKGKRNLFAALALFMVVSGPISADSARTAFIGVGLNNYQLADIRFAGWFPMFYVDLMCPGWGTFITKVPLNIVMGKPDGDGIRSYESGEMERTLSWRVGFLYPIEEFLGVGGGVAFESMVLHYEGLTEPDHISGLAPEVAVHFGLGSKVNILGYATFLNAANKGEDLKLRIETNLSANVSVMPHLSVFASVNYGTLKDYTPKQSLTSIPSFNNTSFYLGLAADLLN